MALAAPKSEGEDGTGRLRHVYIMCNDENPKKLLGVVLGGGNVFKKLQRLLVFQGVVFLCLSDWDSISGLFMFFDHPPPDSATK